MCRVLRDISCKFKVIAVPENEFNAWLMAQSSPAMESSDPLVKEGADVFKSAGCTGCHATKTVINKGSKGRVGPNLAHVASRRDLGAGMMRNADENGSLNDALLQENLRTWIEDPEQIKPGNLMSKGAQVYTDPDKINRRTDIAASALSVIIEIDDCKNTIMLNPVGGR